MRDKVMNALKGRNWTMLSHYHNKYPSNWMREINHCLEDDNNLWEFRYDSNKVLKQIKIITNYGDFKSEWDYYIIFED
ncbi:MAG: hypothetical protein IKG40_02050 [Bacilli bacterium]|nr:hypothetical protein [Bacilli bacterium]